MKGVPQVRIYLAGLRRVLPALVLGVSAAGLFVGGGEAVAAGCPNEALRIGASASLPECRAFEQVTPVDKVGGTGSGKSSFVQTSASGDSVSFISSSAYSDPQGSPLLNRYLATRGAEGWSTTPLDVPQSIQEAIVTRATFLSEDLGKSLTASKEALTPGAIAGGSNLYLRDSATGALTLVLARPGNLLFNEFAGISRRPVAGASADLSRALLFFRSALTPGAQAGKPNLYELADGQIRLAEADAEPAAPNSTARTPYVMSADGSRFFYKQTDEEEGKFEVLYMREDGTRTVPISVSQVVPEGEFGHFAEGQFAGATVDGSVAFFTSFGNLTGESNESALYRYEADGKPGAELTQLAELGGNAKVLAISDDGDYVYFYSQGQITPDAPPAEGGSLNIYVWHGERGEAGSVRFIAQTEAANVPEFSLLQYRASANGKFLALGSQSPLTPAAAAPSPACKGEPVEGIPPDRCVNVFVYSYADAGLVCVTCTGSASPGNSVLGGQDSLEEVITYIPRSVLDDGTVYFGTPAALVPGDTNGLEDVYSWRGGQFQLLSTGTGETGSSFGDATADGHDVFIRTAQQLVGQDVDSALDIYDVRVDGGLAAQAGPPPPAAPCGGETSCRRGSASIPPSPTPSSASLRGAGNLKPGCAASRHRAEVAKRKAAGLTRRAKRAVGPRARSLAHQAHRRQKEARRLARRAHTCLKGASR
jgi:hypothetical protein